MKLLNLLVIVGSFANSINALAVPQVGVALSKVTIKDDLGSLNSNQIGVLGGGIILHPLFQPNYITQKAI